MLLQQSPFRGEDEDEIYDAILADEPLYPIHMPRDSVSILQKLLTREPDQRLGSGPTDAQEIMSQPFFRNINWDDVYHKRLPPPFQPQITSATDTSNFDSEFTSVTPVLTPVQSGKLLSLAITLTSLTHYSSITGYARRVPRLLVLSRLRLNDLQLGVRHTRIGHFSEHTSPVSTGRCRAYRKWCEPFVLYGLKSRKEIHDRKDNRK
jgi:serine/threonine protein kinase